MKKQMILESIIFMFILIWLTILSLTVLEEHDINSKKFEVISDALYVDITQKDFEKINGPDKSSALYWVFQGYYQTTGRRI